MGMIQKKNEEQDFKCTSYILTCEDTGKGLLEIIVKNGDANIFTTVEAKSPFSEGSSSGPQKIKGLLSYGPIQSQSERSTTTTIENIDFNEKNGEGFATISVGIEGAKPK
jgi:hypothetical protein